MDAAARHRELLSAALRSQQGGELASAERQYRQVLAEDSGSFDALHLFGTLRIQQGEPAAAARLIRSALALRADWRAECNLAIALAACGAARDAVAATERAVRLRPDLAPVHAAHGLALRAAGDLPGATDALGRAIAQGPAQALWYVQLAHLLVALRRYADCETVCARGLAAFPGRGDLLERRAVALLRLERFAQADACFEQALAAGAPPGTRSLQMMGRQLACDWRDWTARVESFCAAVGSGDEASDPFVLLLLSDDPLLQRHCAEQAIAAATQGIRGVERRPGPAEAAPIRVAYLSADVRNHATALLIAEMLECHDRERFAICLVGWGDDDGSPIRQRLLRAIDEFIDASALGDEVVAAELARWPADVVIDLRIFGAAARPGILARRPAPVQVSFLGYPGSTGAAFVDYLVADPIVIPEARLGAYREAIAYLPGCYQVTDTTRPVPAVRPLRSRYGLPEAGVVFAAFNNSFKLTPPAFDAWMRILAAVPASTLWLLSDSDGAASHLRNEAAARGVDPIRIVFAPRLPHLEHIERVAAADLFLDTYPCNAHTTASDALWAGVPLVTRRGQTFASRVAASILSSCGLDDLIFDSWPAYEAAAIAIATDPTRQATLRERTRRARGAAAVFDTPSFARAFEAALEEMVGRARAGRRPQSFRLGRGPDGALAAADVALASAPSPAEPR